MNIKSEISLNRVRMTLRFGVKNTLDLRVTDTHRA